MIIKNEQKLLREELFILKKNFFNQTNKDKIVKNKNQINSKNLNYSLNQTLIKNENNTKNDNFLFLKKKEEEKIIENIKKNLNEYYYPLKSNYSLNNFKSLSLKYNTKEDFTYKKNPILSIVIPIYNGEINFLNGLLSIEIQNQKNIEIIYVDDYSHDNSKNLIKEVQKFDKRIVLYENKENKGNFYTRCYGINKARGKYIMSFDHDDLYLDKNLFNNLLNIAEEKKLDILNFEYVTLKNRNIYLQTKFNKPTYNKIINKNELSNNKNILSRQDYSFFTWDKLIRRNIYIEALKLIDKENLNIFMNQGEDICISLCLFKIAKNFMKIKLFGYGYISSEFQSTGIYNKIDKSKNLYSLEIEKYINSFFASEKILYKISDDTENAKLFVIKRLIDSLKTNSLIIKLQNKYTKNLVLEVCNIFINSNFTNNNNKKIIFQFIKNFKKINEMN